MNNEYIRYSYETLECFCHAAFTALGFDEQEAKIISDVLLLSDLYGIESHGMQRVARYHKGIEKGLIKPKNKPEVVFETPVSMVVDGHDGMGQLIGHETMKRVIEKAKVSGVCFASVRSSNHYGIAGYYAKMAADAGLIGFSCTNSESIVVPTFSRMAILGTNPIAVSMPAEPYPFFFDASTSVVTRGKLEIYNKKNAPMPLGWALDKDGNPSSDAGAVLSSITKKEGGGIMPLGGDTECFGGHKGYGYGMLAEIFSSVLSMGLTSNHTHKDGKGGTCHGFAAIDPRIFGNAEEIKAHFSTFLQELRDAPKAEGQMRIYTHGEKEIEAYEKRMKEGIDVHVNTVCEMADFCRFAGLSAEAYLGEIPTATKASSYT